MTKKQIHLAAHFPGVNNTTVWSDPESGSQTDFASLVHFARTAERAVRLTIDSAAVAQLPPPEKGAPEFSPRRSGRLGKLLGGKWRRR